MLGRHLLYQSGPPIPVGETWTFDANASFEIPATGIYKITLVGAGGKGGAGGHTYSASYTISGTRRKCRYIGGGGGGGGGAGETVSSEKKLRRTATLTIVIGTPNGGDSTITGAVTLTARGGGNGGTGSNGRYDSDNNKLIPGSGGAAASVNYGNGISAGAAGSAEIEYGSCFNSGSPYTTVHGSGGAGAISKYGNGYGNGGAGSSTSSGAGANGTKGICVIEYLGR